MALRKFSLVDFLKAVIDRVELGTGKRCYDAVPDHTKAPFYYAEIVGLRPDDTKTMFIDVFEVFIHAIAEPSRSSVGVYDLIQGLQEAMTVDIELPVGYLLVSQASLGSQRISTSGVEKISLGETGEKQAIFGYEFKVCYGYRVK